MLLRATNSMAGPAFVERDDPHLEDQMRAEALLQLVAVVVVILERLQARDSPVPLESGSAAETPTGETSRKMGRTAPDPRGSARPR